MACEGRDALGCRMLGLMALSGQGVPRDQARARALLDTACRGRDRVACATLAENGWAELGRSP